MISKIVAFSIAAMSFGMVLAAASTSQAGLSVNQEVMLCISKATTPADKQACIDFWKDRTPTQTVPAEQGQSDMKAEVDPKQPIVRQRR